MKQQQLNLSIDSISLYALYGNACLGVMHPLNKGKSREISLVAIKAIGAYLVEAGVITEGMRLQHECALNL